MKFVALLAILAQASALLSTGDDKRNKELWDEFRAEHGKHYGTMEEEIKRFDIFVKTLKVIDERNAAEKQNGGTAEHGITRFADMTQLEFETQFLLAEYKPKAKVQDDIVLGEPDLTAGTVDWTGKYTTPVKNQMQCGSCWAFSATEQVESDAMRTLNKEWILSPEQIVQCDTTCYGCNGGFTENAYKYIEKAGGLTTNSAYPYTSGNGVTGHCPSSVPKPVVTVTGYKTLGSESQMASYMQSTGPLSVCVDASNWNTYRGGILSSCGKRVDHCVQAVGVQATSGGYWKVRNSWGTSWGESGFIRLAYGQNTCNIDNDPTYTSVKTV